MVFVLSTKPMSNITEVTKPEAGTEVNQSIYGPAVWRRPEELGVAQRAQAKVLDPSIKTLEGHLFLVTRQSGRVVRVIRA